MLLKKDSREVNAKVKQDNIIDDFQKKDEINSFISNKGSNPMEKNNSNSKKGEIVEESKSEKKKDK